MKDGATASSDTMPAACKPAPRESQSNSETSTPPKFPEGVYRADLPAEYLISKGMDPQTAHDLAGLNTLSIKDGRWRGSKQGSPGECGGPYSVDDGRLSLRHDVAQCGAPAGLVVMSARWKLQDDELLFFDFRDGRPIEWGSKPWTKID